MGILFLMYLQNTLCDLKKYIPLWLRYITYHFFPIRIKSNYYIFWSFRIMVRPMYIPLVITPRHCDFIYFQIFNLIIVYSAFDTFYHYQFPFYIWPIIIIFSKTYKSIHTFWQVLHIHLGLQNFNIKSSLDRSIVRNRWCAWKDNVLNKLKLAKRAWSWNSFEVWKEAKKNLVLYLWKTLIIN